MQIRRASEQPRSGRNQSGGYILLALIFAAALVAISLALTLPRAAMRAQGIREERLIYRGKQYERAIRLYFRENKKYPEELEDLEDTNGVRYLRRRYKDPITGEDEWRIIHMGTDGRFKDSLLYDTEEEEWDPVRGSSAGGFGSSGMSRSTRRPVQTGPPPTGYFAGGDRALAVRQSAAVNPNEDRGPYASQEALAGLEAGGGQQQGGEGEQRPAPDFSGVLPGQVPLEAGQRLPRRPGEPAPPVRPGPRTRQRPGFGNSSLGAQRRQQQQPTGGQPAGFGRQGVGTQASNIIQRLLTTPRPGGLRGLQQSNSALSRNQPAAFQEGIAGVASKAEDHGVRVYRGKENYNEWEFVYDYRKEKGLGGGAVGGMGGGGLAAGQPGANASGTLGMAATRGGAVMPGGTTTRIPGPAAQPGMPGQPPNPNDPRGGFGRTGPSVFYPPTAPINQPGAGPYPTTQPPAQPGPGTPPTQPNSRLGRQLPTSRFGGRNTPTQPQPHP